MDFTPDYSVTDEDGKVVDSWTSGKEAHIIKELVAGKKYTLTETKPADGYVTAESITFTVEDSSKAQKIEMKDDVTKVQISKTDISGKELPGAKLTILDKDGKVVERDADVMTAAFKEYTGKSLNKTKKPSVRTKLKDAITQAKDKNREREKTKQKEKEPTL